MKLELEIGIEFFFNVYILMASGAEPGAWGGSVPPIKSDKVTFRPHISAKCSENEKKMHDSIAYITCLFNNG